jgi:hypothetical protein
MQKLYKNKEGHLFFECLIAEMQIVIMYTPILYGEEENYQIVEKEMFV